MGQPRIAHVRPIYPRPHQSCRALECPRSLSPLYMLPHLPSRAGPRVADADSPCSLLIRPGLMTRPRQRMINARAETSENHLPSLRTPASCRGRHNGQANAQQPLHKRGPSASPGRAREDRQSSVTAQACGEEPHDRHGHHLRPTGATRSARHIEDQTTVFHYLRVPRPQGLSSRN